MKDKNRQELLIGVLISIPIALSISIMLVLLPQPYNCIPFALMLLLGGMLFMVQSYKEAKENNKE